MGTISDKLTYLNTTKTMLRDSLNKFGSSILSTDTFRSYDTKLNDIYDKLPKVTATGQGLTISNVQNGLLDDFKMNGVDLEQDTTTGKNILPQNEYISSTTINGITYTNNGDGTFSLSGTATAETSIRIIPTEKFNLNNGQQYYLYSSIPYNSSTFNMSIVTLENGTQNYLIVNNNYTPATTPTNSRLQFYIAQGNTVNAQNIKLMLVKGNNDTDYEPYTGGIASPNPDYPQEIKVVEGRQVVTDKGKNLLNPYTEPTERYGITASYNQNTHVYTFNGTCTRDNITFILSNNKINFTTQVTKSITFWVGGSCTNSCDIRHFDSNYNSNVIYSIVNISSTNNKISKTSNYTFESPINYATIRFNNGSVANNLQIKVMVTDDDNTDYEPYYNPVSYNIDLNLENIYLAKIPNTNYKNRIYKNNGNWYYEKNIEKIILDGNAIWYKYNNNFCLESITNYNRVTNIPICTHFKGIDMTIGTSISIEDNDKTIRFGNNENASAFRVFIIDSDFSDARVLKNFLLTHNVELWYILATPVTTQITNATLINQLEAISVHTGTNIITISNDNNIIPEIEITRLKELEKLA